MLDSSSGLRHPDPVWIPASTDPATEQDDLFEINLVSISLAGAVPTGAASRRITLDGHRLDILSSLETAITDSPATTKKTMQTFLEVERDTTIDPVCTVLEDRHYGGYIDTLHASLTLHSGCFALRDRALRHSLHTAMLMTLVRRDHGDAGELPHSILRVSDDLPAWLEARL